MAGAVDLAAEMAHAPAPDHRLLVPFPAFQVKRPQLLHYNEEILGRQSSWTKAPCHNLRVQSKFSNILIFYGEIERLKDKLIGWKPQGTLTSATCFTDDSTMT